MHEPHANEEISAFVDGELRGPARDWIVGMLYGDSELRRAWERFHLIGDAVRKVGPVPGAGSIAGKVSEALSGERIVPFRPRAWRLGIGPLPGLALAASVAAIAILGIRGLDDGGGGQLPVAGASRHEVAASPATAVAAAETPAAGASRQKAAGSPTTLAGIVTDPAPSHVAATAGRNPRRETTRLQWSDAAPDAEARLNAYLVNHNEFAGHGVRGVLPYVRVVGYQSAAGG